MELRMGVENVENRMATAVTRRSSRKMNRMAVSMGHSTRNVWRKRTARKMTAMRTVMMKSVRTRPRYFPRMNWARWMRLGQEGEDRLLVDLLVDEPRPHEDGHEHAEEGDGGEPDVLDDLDPVADRQDGQDPGEDDADGGEEEQEVEDAVPLGLLERVPGDGRDLHLAPHHVHEDVLERLGPGDEGIDASLLLPDEVEDPCRPCPRSKTLRRTRPPRTERLSPSPARSAGSSPDTVTSVKRTRLRDEVVERALADDPAADDDGHAVADHLDVLEDVRGEEDGLALAA